MIIIKHWKMHCHFKFFYKNYYKTVENKFVSLKKWHVSLSILPIRNYRFSAIIGRKNDCKL